MCGRALRNIFHNWPVPAHSDYLGNLFLLMAYGFFWGILYTIFLFVGPFSRLLRTPTYGSHDAAVSNYSSTTASDGSLAGLRPFMDQEGSAFGGR
jgi:hypothetical protein